ARRPPRRKNGSYERSPGFQSTVGDPPFQHDSRDENEHDENDSMLDLLDPPDDEVEFVAKVVDRSDDRRNAQQSRQKIHDEKTRERNMEHSRGEINRRA